MKQIVIVNQDSGYLMIDIANSYVGKGYQTVLVAGRLVERDVKLSNGVQIEKIIRYNRTSNVKRFYTWIVGTIQILLVLRKKKYRNSEFLFVSNPPLAPLLSIFLENRFSVLVFDLYPDAFVDYGFLKEKSWFIQWWGQLNRKAYHKALKIFTSRFEAITGTFIDIASSITVLHPSNRLGWITA